MRCDDDDDDDDKAFEKRKVLCTIFILGSDMGHRKLD